MVNNVMSPVKALSTISLLYNFMLTVLIKIFSLAMMRSYGRSNEIFTLRILTLRSKA